MHGISNESGSMNARSVSVMCGNETMSGKRNVKYAMIHHHLCPWTEISNAFYWWIDLNFKADKNAPNRILYSKSTFAIRRFRFQYGHRWSLGPARLCFQFLDAFGVF